MSRRSSIARLPQEIKKKISDLRGSGYTIDEILEKLSELKVDVSRSALGRHCKRLESVQKSIRQSREIAEAIVKTYGEDKENKVAKANIEIMHSILFRMMGSDDGEPVTLSPKDVMFLSSSLEKLVKASKTDFEKEVGIRKEIKTKAEKTLSEIENKQGLSKETVDLIKEKILGAI